MDKTTTNNVSKTEFTDQPLMNTVETTTDNYCPLNDERLQDKELTSQRVIQQLLMSTETQAAAEKLVNKLNIEDAAAAAVPSTVDPAETVSSKVQGQEVVHGLAAGVGFIGSQFKSALGAAASGIGAGISAGADVAWTAGTLSGASRPTRGGQKHATRQSPNPQQTTDNTRHRVQHSSVNSSTALEMKLSGKTSKKVIGSDNNSRQDAKRETTDSRSSRTASTVGSRSNQSTVTDALRSQSVKPRDSRTTLALMSESKVCESVAVDDNDEITLDAALSTGLTHKREDAESSRSVAMDHGSNMEFSARGDVQDKRECAAKHLQHAARTDVSATVQLNDKRFTKPAKDETTGSHVARTNVAIKGDRNEAGSRQQEIKHSSRNDTGNVSQYQEQHTQQPTPNRKLSKSENVGDSTDPQTAEAFDQSLDVAASAKQTNLEQQTVAAQGHLHDTNELAEILASETRFDTNVGASVGSVEEHGNGRERISSHGKSHRHSEPDLRVGGHGAQQGNLQTESMTSRSEGHDSAKKQSYEDFGEKMEVLHKQKENQVLIQSRLDLVGATGKSGSAPTSSTTKRPILTSVVTSAANDQLSHHDINSDTTVAERQTTSLGDSLNDSQHQNSSKTVARHSSFEQNSKQFDKKNSAQMITGMDHGRETEMEPRKELTRIDGKLKHQEVHVNQKATNQLGNTKVRGEKEITELKSTIKKLQCINQNLTQQLETVSLKQERLDRQLHDLQETNKKLMKQERRANEREMSAVKALTDLRTKERRVETELRQLHRKYTEVKSHSRRTESTERLLREKLREAAAEIENTKSETTKWRECEGMLMETWSQKQSELLFHVEQLRRREMELNEHLRQSEESQRQMTERLERTKENTNELSRMRTRDDADNKRQTQGELETSKRRTVLAKSRDEDQRQRTQRELTLLAEISQLKSLNITTEKLAAAGQRKSELDMKELEETLTRRAVTAEYELRAALQNESTLHSQLNQLEQEVKKLKSHLSESAVKEQNFNAKQRNIVRNARRDEPQNKEISKIDYVENTQTESRSALSRKADRTSTDSTGNRHQPETDTDDCNLIGQLDQLELENRQLKMQLSLAADTELRLKEQIADEQMKISKLHQRLYSLEKILSVRREVNETRRVKHTQSSEENSEQLIEVQRQTLTLPDNEPETCEQLETKLVESEKRAKLLTEMLTASEEKETELKRELQRLQTETVSRVGDDVSSNLLEQRQRGSNEVTDDEPAVKLETDTEKSLYTQLQLSNKSLQQVRHELSQSAAREHDLQSRAESLEQSEHNCQLATQSLQLEENVLSHEQNEQPRLNTLYGSKQELISVSKTVHVDRVTECDSATKHAEDVDNLSRRKQSVSPQKRFKTNETQTDDKLLPKQLAEFGDQQREQFHEMFGQSVTEDARLNAARLQLLAGELEHSQVREKLLQTKLLSLKSQFEKKKETQLMTMNEKDLRRRLVETLQKQKMFRVELNSVKQTNSQLVEHLKRSTEKMQQLTRQVEQYKSTHGQLTKHLNSSVRILTRLPAAEAVRGVTSLNNHVYVLRHRPVDQLEVYDVTFRLQRHLSIHSLQPDELSDMTSCSRHNCLYVTDARNCCINRLEPSTDCGSADITRWTIGDIPVGVSVVQSSCLVLVTCRTQLRQFTTNGQLQHVISLTSDLQPANHSLQLRSTGQYVVCHGDWSTHVHRVSLVDCSGSQLLVVRTFGGVRGGSSDRQLDGPRHLAVDRGDFIYVADELNHRVVLLGPQLEFVRDVMERNRSRSEWTPVRLCVVGTDRDDMMLYVADSAWEEERNVGSVIVACVKNQSPT